MAAAHLCSLLASVVGVWNWVYFYLHGIAIAMDDMFCRGRKKYNWEKRTPEILAAPDTRVVEPGAENWAVVTGGNGGLGLSTATNLARAGMHVIVACRSLERGQQACQAILDDLQEAAAVATATGTLDTAPLGVHTHGTPAGVNVIPMPCDLSDLKSVRAFSKAIHEHFNGVDGALKLIVANAGVMGTPFLLTKQGFLMQPGTNHLGHALLIDLLLPTLKERGGRVVVVSSAEAAHGVFDPLDYQDLSASFEERETHRRRYTERCLRFASYANSKLGNVVYGLQVSRELEVWNRSCPDRAVTINMLHPGCLDTNITRNLGLLSLFTYLASKLIQIRTSEGAAYVSQLCLCPTLASTSGEWFRLAYPTPFPAHLLHPTTTEPLVRQTRRIIDPYKMTKSQSSASCGSL